MRANYIEELEEWKNGFSFSVPVTVRFSETDMFGHLNNTVAVAYFEYARIEFMKHIGLMEDYLKADGEKIPVVADVQCDYVKQVYFDEQLTVSVKAAKVGTSSVDLHYWITGADGETCLTGRGTLVQISRKTGKGSPWTETEKTLLMNKVDAPL